MRRAASWAFAAAALAPGVGARAQQPLPALVDRSLAPYASTKESVELPDGRTLHLVCMGQGSPTVVLTAGAGAWGLTWNKVQGGVAKTTRTCAWDRAGFGLSTPPASPQTVDQSTSDLQAALRVGGIAGPYVLVGHSLGGYESLLLADREQDSVAGMVLVDPSFPDQLAALTSAAPAQAGYMLSLPNPLRSFLGKCSAALKAGTLRVGGPDPDNCLHPQWPADYPPELAAALSRLPATATAGQMLAAWDTMLFFGSPQLLESDAKLAVNPARNYGAMPLIVLTHTVFQPPDGFPAAAAAEIPAEEAAWNEGHDALAALSTRGVNARVPGAPHFIQDVKPQVVIDAIEQVCAKRARTEGTEMRASLMALSALAISAPACSERADYYRGGWAIGPRVYEFVIDGATVSGVACTHCADGTTLARLVGTFDEKTGIAFTVRNVAPDGSLLGEDHAEATLDGTRLVIHGTRAGGESFAEVAVKDPRGPTPGGYPQARLPPDSPPVAIVKGPGVAAGGPPAPYHQPAPWRPLTADDVAGVWLGFGVGIEKQYFLIRKDGDELFGLACGRCDNPYTMGALDHFSIHGDTLEFDIEHQDWGEGDHVPFVRHVTAHIAMNEMRMDARRTDAPERPGIVASLVGPISIEATKGNVYGE